MNGEVYVVLVCLGKMCENPIRAGALSVRQFCFQTQKKT